MKRILFTFGCLAALACPKPASAGSVTVLQADFDPAAAALPSTASFRGAGKLSATRGYEKLGFGDTFLRNHSGGRAASRTTLRLSDLPDHSGIDLDFLLAVIGSWDGPAAHYGGDTFRIKVDGKLVFNGVFSNGFRSHLLPRHGKLIKKARLGFGRYRDSAFDMSDVAALSDIAHTGDSLKIEFFARGKNWQGGRDESFALDRLRVTLKDVPDLCPPPPPAPVPLPASVWTGLLLMGLAGTLKLRSVRRRNAP